MNGYSGILPAAFICASRFFYIQYMITFYKCTAWEGALSYYKHSIKHKTNMGQPHYKQRPRESKTISPAPNCFPPAAVLVVPAPMGSEGWPACAWQVSACHTKSRLQGVGPPRGRVSREECIRY